MARSKKGESVAKLGLDYTQFAAAVKSVRGLTNILSGAVSSAIGNVTATAITKAAGALTKFIAGAKDGVVNSYRLGESLDNLSKRTGIAAQHYQTFALAMEKGLSMEDAGKVLGDNARRMAQNASLFRDISIKFDAAGKRLEGFWIGVAEKIAPVLNPLLDRLTALDLSQWGEAFAGPIADAVAVIVQLADDGELWATLGKALQIALLSGADVLEYLGKLGGEIFQAIVAGGFDKGVMVAIDTWLSFVKWASTTFESVATAFGDALFDVITTFQEIWNNILDEGNAFALSLGLGDAKKVAEGKARRDADIGTRHKSAGEPVAPNYSPQDSMSETIAKIMERAGPFSLSGGSNQAIGEFTSKITGALEKFYSRPEVKNPEKFANKTPLSETAFGVDSLSAAGGGGGIGNLAVSVAEKQLDKLTEIVNLMRGDSQRKSSNQNFYRQPNNSTKRSGLFSSPLRSVSLSNY